MQYHHHPVLLPECLGALNIDPAGSYLDCTLGGGGHASEILRRLDGGTLIGIDRDAEAIAAAGARLSGLNPRATFTAIRGNFHDAKALLEPLGITRLDGVLVDLGVSSQQLDEGARGFSYHADAPLDMRMDTRQALSARTIVNEWSEDELCRVLRDYGEEKWARQIARVIRDRRPIETTGQLVDAIDAAIPKKMRDRDGSHPARRTFQALRIAVNDELAPLDQALRDLVSLLRPGGRIVVLSFHSLEDRIVKNCFRELADPCTCPKDFPVCVCGRKPSLKLINRKPITAGETELAANPRARSATLRAGERIEGGILG